MSDVWMVLERDQGIGSLDELARARGWTLDTDHVRTFFDGSQRLWEVREGVRVGRVDDLSFGVPMVLVRGDARLADELARELPGRVSEDELRRRAMSDELPAALDALRALVVVTAARATPGEFDRVRPLMERWSQHPSEAIRHAVLRLALRAHRAALPFIAAHLDDPLLSAQYRRLHEILTTEDSASS